MAADAYDLKISQHRRGRLPVAEDDLVTGKVSDITGMVDLQTQGIGLATVNAFPGEQELRDVVVFEHERMFAPGPDGTDPQLTVALAARRLALCARLAS